MGERDAESNDRRPEADSTTTRTLCATCGVAIDTTDWHPVSTERTSDGTLHVRPFCDEDCRTAWLRESSTASATAEPTVTSAAGSTEEPASGPTDDSITHSTDDPTTDSIDDSIARSTDESTAVDPESTGESDEPVAGSDADASREGSRRAPRPDDR